jgi:hypothetical protein
MLRRMTISSHCAIRKELMHPQDVEYIKLQADRLDNGIGLHGPHFYHSRMGKNLLGTTGVNHMLTPV